MPVERYQEGLNIYMIFTHIFTAIILSACVSRIEFTSLNSSSSSSSTTTSNSTAASYLGTLTSTVQSIYPSNGANWNDYINYTSSSSGPYAQDDVACNGAISGNAYAACIHGGEKLKIEVPLSSCSGLSGRDNLRVFDWVCETNGSEIIFYTKALKKGKGLKDLVDATEFKDNYFEVVSSNQVVYDTNPEKWWSNTVQAAPDSSGGQQVLGSNGTIYTVSTTSSSMGYLFAVDKVSLVTLNDAYLDDGGQGSNCTGNETHICLTGIDFVWIEADLKGDDSAFVNIKINAVDYTRIHGSQVYAANVAIRIDSSNNYLISENKIHSAQYGIILDTVTDSVVIDNTLMDLGTDGIRFTNGSVRNTIYNNTIGSIGRYGVYLLSNSTGNYFSRVKIANNYGSGIISNTSTNALGFITSINHEASANGIFAEGDSLTIFQTFLANNTASGLTLNTQASSSTVAQVLAYSNGSYGINSTGNDNSFRTGFYYGSNGTSDCQNTGTNNEIDGACNFNVGTASAPVTAVDASSSFIGMITTDDSSNFADASGVATSTTIDTTNLDFSDWVTFESNYRLWGVDGSTFPNADNRGHCTSDTCHIWDLRLNSSDTAARNINGTFTAGSACPSSVSGSNPDNYIEGILGTHLVNAFEIVGDFIGNENSLCESNEACIFAPNIGAYQGEGDYSSNGTCTFTDGTISGVTMYAYPTNGATP